MEMKKMKLFWWVLLVSAARFVGVAKGSPQVPAMFVMGDSLVDSGNNNYLNSIAKSNYYPYGCDLRVGPTGRFSNGLTFADFLAQRLGVQPPAPFADPATSGARLFNGVNYASAAAGILDETGQNYGDRYPLSQQVLNFESNLAEMRRLMSPQDLTSFLARSVVLVVFGSNDYLNNYLMPALYPSGYRYTPYQYANLLLNRYARQLVALYNLGLRRFLLPGIGPLGCIPNQLATGQAAPGRCVDYVNQILGPFNDGLKRLVDIMNNGSHPGATFVYGNSYGAIGDVLNNLGRYGFTVWDRACCGIGRNQGTITCLMFVTPCPNRNQYMFWDAFHPTQAVNAILATRAYSGSSSDVYPMNVQQMAINKV